MGEAKRRGTYEQRKSEGEERKRLEKEERLKLEAEYEASLTLEEKEKRHQTRMRLAMLMGLAGSIEDVFEI